MLLFEDSKAANVHRSHACVLYHVSLLVVLVFDDEDHVETGQDGGHEVDVVFSLCVIPAAEHGVGSGQN